MVIRNDAMTVEQIAALKPERIVISPGPCTPNEAGVSLKLIEQLGSSTPILGICLGHQSIGQAYGAMLSALPISCTVKHRRFTTMGKGCLLVCQMVTMRRVTIRWLLIKRHYRMSGSDCTGQRIRMGRLRKSWACATASILSKVCSSILSRSSPRMVTHC